MVNLYTVLVGIATDRLHHPSGSRHFRHVPRAALDVDTLLFASGNALVQFSPMLIIPVLAPLMTQLLGASQGLLPWLFFGGGLAGYLSTRMTGALTSRVSALSLATGSTLVLS